MAFILCSLTGTALSWYIRLDDTYKQDWHAFVQAFKKQFSSQKNAYYDRVEALNLSKKDNETVRHFALKVHQLVEKGWCNENASTNNLKCNEIFTKGIPKNLKDFANKRQIKQTLKVLYNVTQIKKKKITFDQYSRSDLEGPKIAICETASNVVFVLNSSVTTKDHYFRTALQEATDAFNNILLDFVYTQKLEIYDPLQHQAHPPQQHLLFA